jgi:hypothetical protein
LYLSFVSVTCVIVSSITSARMRRIVALAKFRSSSSFVSFGRVVS